MHLSAILTWFWFFVASYFCYLVFFFFFLGGGDLSFTFYAPIILALKMSLSVTRTKKGHCHELHHIRWSDACPCSFMD